MAVSLVLAFLLRGVCWEATVWASPVGLVVALARRRKPIVLALVALTLCAGLATVEFTSLTTYHSLWPFTQPRILIFCGAYYQPEGPAIHVPPGRSLKVLPAAGAPGPVKSFGVTPDGSAIVATGGNIWTGCPDPLYVAVGHDRWLAYGTDPF